MKRPANVEIILTGGIGNQLFQYAYGRYISLKENLPLKLNIYKFGIHTLGETKRNFGLENLNIDGDIISDERIVGKNRFLDRFLKKGILKRYCFEGSASKFGEINWGYWLDGQFANAIRSELSKDFTLRKPVPAELAGFFNEFESNRILGIHVRRGDYVSNKSANKTHGVLDVDYYQQAIKKVKEKTSFDYVYFFTDDPQWIRENFPNAKIVEQNHDPIFEILLMAKSTAMIISNSTFSWWAAWLNEKSECTVAPKRWFVTQKNPDIYDPKWILL